MTRWLTITLVAGVSAWGQAADSNLRAATLPVTAPGEPVVWAAFETAQPAQAVVVRDEQQAPQAGPTDCWVVRHPGWTPALLNARGQAPDLTLDPKFVGTGDLYLGLRSVDPQMSFGIRLDTDREFTVITAPAATPTHHFDFEFHWRAGVTMTGRQVVLHTLGQPVYVQYLKWVAPHTTTQVARVPAERAVVLQEKGRHFAFPGVAEVAPGELLVVCREGDAHVCPRGRIVATRSTDAGRTWSPRQVVFDSPSDERDPAILKLRDGTVVVSYNCWDSWRGSADLRAKYAAATAHMEQVGWGKYAGSFLVVSKDQGRTWSAPVTAPVFSPHGPVEGPDGALYWVGHETRDGKWVVVIHRTADLGRTWTRWGEVAYCRPESYPLDFEAYDEPNLLLLPDGRGICTVRVEVDGYVRQAYTTDGGRTWGWPRKLPVWGFPQQLCALRDGRLLLAYGYRRPPFGVRACLSSDGGRTWDLAHELVLRHEGGHGDLGYPYSVQLQDGRVFTVYYYNHQGGDCYLEGVAYRP